jgi:hypothetical protein
VRPCGCTCMPRSPMGHLWVHAELLERMVVVHRQVAEECVSLGAVGVCVRALSARDSDTTAADKPRAFALKSAAATPCGADTFTPHLRAARLLRALCAESARARATLAAPPYGARLCNLKRMPLHLQRTCNWNHDEDAAALGVRSAAVWARHEVLRSQQRVAARSGRPAHARGHTHLPRCPASPASGGALVQAAKPRRPLPQCSRCEARSAAATAHPSSQSWFVRASRMMAAAVLLRKRSSPAFVAH